MKTKLPLLFVLLQTILYQSFSFSNGSNYNNTTNPLTSLCNAGFTYSPIQGDTVYFQNNSSGNIDSVLWSFGDGYYSSEFSPTHVFDFAADSIYEVCLTIISDSCQDIYCNTIFYMDTVSPPEPICDAAFTYDPIQGDTVHFFNTSSGNIDTVFWSFGDGTFSSEFSPTHVFDFDADSIYEVCLTIISDSCQDTYCNTIFYMDTVYPPEPICDAAFTYDPIQGDTVHFFNTSSGNIDTVFWSFGDGTFSSEFSPTHVFDFDADSIYEVCLTIISDSCQDTYCNTIFYMDTVSPPEPICDAAFTYDPIQGDTVHFFNTSSGNIDTVFWSFGDGTFSSEFSPTHVFDFDADSIYEVCLTVISDSCQDTYCNTIFYMDTVYPPEPICDAAFTYDPIQGDTVHFFNTSSGNIDTVFWSFGDGYYSSEFSPTHVFDFDADSIYEVCLTIISDSCQDTYCNTIFYMDTVSPPEPVCDAAFSYDPIQGDTVHFFNTSSGNIDTVFWSFGDGYYSSEFSPLHVFDFDADSIYEVCLTIISDSCQDTYCNTVFYMDTITPPEPICDAAFTFSPVQGDTVFFYNNSSGNFDSVLWSFGDGYYSSEFSPLHVFDFDADSIYEVCLTIISDSCQDTYCNTISYSPGFCGVSFSYAYPDTGYTINFTGYSYSTSEVNTWLWNFDDGTSSNIRSPEHTFDISEKDMFNVCVTIKTMDNCEATFCSNIGFSCAADFNYQKSNEFEKVVFFNDNSTGNINYRLWDFGDGSYSYEKNPIHSFEGATDSITGNNNSFNVCLTVYDYQNHCQNKICKTINFNDSVISTGYSISGTVKAGESNLDNGFILLYQQIDTLLFDAKDATVIDNGSYQFTGVEQGEYILHAIPNLTAETMYLPTYYVSQLHWRNATKLLLNADASGVDISLKSKRGIFSGVGSVEGKILSNLESDQAITNVPVVLVDSDNNELSFVIPDASGYFEFNNLNYGTYYIYPETPNADNIRKVEINITPDNYSIKNLQVTFDETATYNISQKVKEPSLIYYSNQEIIIETTDIIFDGVEIFNIIGQNLTNKVNVSVEGNKIHLVTDRLSNGLYIINLTNKDSRYSLKYMK